MPDPRCEQWATIAAALLLLGHGYVDHAHNLIGPLSYHTDLPYFHGPLTVADPDVLAAASHIHCLVHRREGPHRGEFGQTGYANSNFWASATLRSGGEETLPLARIFERVENCALDHGHEAQQWCRNNIVGIVELWDPRPLTQLCSEVLPSNEITSRYNLRRHSLKQFAEHAALTELQVLLEHSLDKLGFHRVQEATSLSSVRLLVRAPSTNKLPKTLQEAMASSFGGSFKDDAVVVTTASAPHEIIY
ncbi:MAG: hypothetical protein SGARI_000443, partial [Bacillariaceae sp.]